MGSPGPLGSEGFGPCWPPGAGRPERSAATDAAHYLATTTHPHCHNHKPWPARARARHSPHLHPHLTSTDPPTDAPKTEGEDGSRGVAEENGRRERKHSKGQWGVHDRGALQVGSYWQLRIQVFRAKTFEVLSQPWNPGKYRPNQVSSRPISHAARSRLFSLRCVGTRARAAPASGRGTNAGVASGGEQWQAGGGEPRLGPFAR